MNAPRLIPEPKLRLPEFVIRGDKVTIGRSSNNDLVVDHRSVSGQHAEIVRDGTKWVIQDRESKNGTWIEGRRFGIRTLEDRARIRLGDVSFTFRSGDGSDGALAGAEPPEAVVVRRQGVDVVPIAITALVALVTCAAGWFLSTRHEADRTRAAWREHGQMKARWIASEIPGIGDAVDLTWASTGATDRDRIELFDAHGRRVRSEGASAEPIPVPPPGSFLGREMADGELPDGRYHQFVALKRGADGAPLGYVRLVELVPGWANLAWLTPLATAGALGAALGWGISNRKRRAAATLAAHASTVGRGDDERLAALLTRHPDLQELFRLAALAERGPRFGAPVPGVTDAEERDPGPQWRLVHLLCADLDEGFLWSEGNAIQVVNDAALRLLDLRRADLVGPHLLELATRPETRDLANLLIAQLARPEFNRSVAAVGRGRAQLASWRRGHTPVVTMLLTERGDQPAALAERG